jgi:transposase
MSNPQPKPKRRFKRYSSEFKREALLRASEEGMTDKAVCDELGISTRQFKRWRDELALLGKEAFPGSGVSRDQEVSALKRELAQVKKERDFLREAAAYFARRSQ